MNIKRLFTIIALLPAIWQATAQNHDYVYSDYEMENGTIYTGFISCQSFIENTITIDAKVVLKVIPTKEVCIYSEEKGKSISDLDENLRAWLAGHPHLLQAPDSCITIGNIKIEENGMETTYNDAVLLEKEANIKFVAVHREEKTVNSRALLTTTKKKLPDNVLSGVKEICETKDRSQGQVIRKQKDSILVIDNNGKEKIISKDTVAKNRVIFMDNSQPYIEQIPFIETVVTKTGNHEGYIKEQIYATNGKPGYILIQTGNSSIERVEYADIQEIRRAENKDFRPIFEQNTSTKRHIEADQYIICDSITANTLPSKVHVENMTCYIEDNINLPYNVVNLSSEQVKNGLKFEFKKNDENFDIILAPVTLKKNFPKSLSFFSLNNPEIAVEHENRDDIETYIFQIDKATDHFAIYNKGTGKVVIINVK